MFVLLWNPVVPKNDYTIDFLAAAAPIASISLNADVITLHRQAEKPEAISILCFQLCVPNFH